MIPDRTNYEIWLLDHLDGNLNPRQVEHLMSFLDENPDLKEKCSEFIQYNIKPDDISFRHKNRLKKSVSDISESQFEYLCVASLENDLSDQHHKELREIIAGRPEKRKTYELIQKLKLVAPEVKYRKKSRLRKLTAIQQIARYTAIGLSAAATVSIVISLLNLPLKNNTMESPMAAALNSKDSNIAGVNFAKITGNIAAEDKKGTLTEKKKETAKRSVNIIPSSQNAISDKNKSFDKESSTTDLSAETSVIRPVIISIIDFKQNVNVVEKSITSPLVEIKTSDINISGTDEKHGFIELIALIFRKNILRSKYPEPANLKAYELADTGIAGLNKLLGWQMSLKKNLDEKGEVKSVYFSSKILKFNVPVKKADTIP
jgi:hypothetical protein